MAGWQNARAQGVEHSRSHLHGTFVREPMAPAGKIATLDSEHSIVGSTYTRHAECLPAPADGQVPLATNLLTPVEGDLLAD